MDFVVEGIPKMTDVKNIPTMLEGEAFSQGLLERPTIVTAVTPLIY